MFNNADQRIDLFHRMQSRHHFTCCFTQIGVKSHPNSGSSEETVPEARPTELPPLMRLGCPETTFPIGIAPSICAGKQVERRKRPAWDRGKHADVSPLRMKEPCESISHGLCLSTRPKTINLLLFVFGIAH
ncbi:hypothetical protein M4578_03050 [Salipiger sp. P9]|uniref:hypothetical protein n=1 Tax=Salipiger pentaromativorans TaxID=2943193 RepID=UPI002157650F|nr:hypothetical protein [Salipiger pentaromativorans]MCR8546792.1 hypothetical protein [Salipiger pentaromativorans]